MRRAPLEMDVAIHEAGHAVAHLLTANLMGYAPNEAVLKIDVNSFGSQRSHDGRTFLMCQAICFAPSVSKALSQACRDHIAAAQVTSMPQAIEIYSRFGDADEFALSMSKRMLCAVMGAAAEANYRSTDALAVFRDYACEDDRIGFYEGCAGLEIELSQIEHFEIAYVDAANSLVARAAVWNAIASIARRLKGCMSGRKIAQFAWPKLQSDPAAVAAAEEMVKTLAAIGEAV